jgi:3-polyprenyl-4-hydroxybenzoate decarboxylase
MSFRFHETHTRLPSPFREGFPVSAGKRQQAGRSAAGLPPQRGYRDLHEHLRALDEAGLLLKVERPIDKDSELHPLVRWQFVGRLPEASRKAFLFTNIHDGRGRKYDIPVVVGAIAANRAIYSIGMDAPVAEIEAKWNRAIAHPVPPRIVEQAACHDVIWTGDALKGEGNGLDRLPIPI